MPTVRNVHRRLLAAAPDQVGGLLDSLGGPADRLWPRRRWPAMRLDAPLGVGAGGGHGLIGYVVTRHEPGRLAEFTFTAPRGVEGTHTFLVLPDRSGRTVLEHRIDARTSGLMRLGWPLVVRPLHDALLEDCLDRAQHELGAPPARPARWSPWVRLLRTLLRRLA
ncbi:hypothetical protein [Auraticoccus monumenti]|uniref:Polyketide cyclase / dehydrase and lipid transport n=1 Tax=Auraticoccus monumenti TaxID=675864 RepID=A0A1G7EAN2_9ACTN|nr:hypothetical protein [Auraticoccus monumenti]SDE60718.1 hypothetical protein SAMN04489747_3884 [Auraticoccus monumenti]